MIDIYTLIGKYCMVKNIGLLMFYFIFIELFEKKFNEYDDVFWFLGYIFLY